MLGLSNEIGCDERRASRIAHDHDFRRPREHIDCAVERDELLRRSHKGIAGSNDLVNAWNRASAVCKCGDPLRAAYRIKLLHPEQGRGCQGFRRGSRRHHHDSRYSRYLRGNHRHQQRRRQRMASTRYIASDGLERTNHLPESNASLHIAHPLQRFLPLSEAPDILRGALKCSAKLRADLPPRGIDV